MTWVLKERGAGAFVSAEYRCPSHGIWAEVVERPAPDYMPCPECNDVSAWTISAPAYKPNYASVTTGKPEEQPHPLSVSTKELADGMSTNEWKQKRAKLWRDQRRAEIRSKT